MDIKNILTAAITALVVVVMVNVLVGNQGVGAGTRFPNGLSADGTAPSAGEVRGTTLTITGDSTISGSISALELIETVTADNTLTVSESGTTYYASTNFSTTTLPAVASSAGVTYRFVVSAAISTGDFRVVSAEGDNIEGSLIVAGAVVDCAAADRINFVTDGENVGDFVEIRSNGTNWFVTQSNALTSAKLTCSG